MKVFGLGLFFDLIDEPSWLRIFRKKYDDPIGYHISLKLPTYIKNNNLPKLEEISRNTAGTSKIFNVEFNKYFFNKTSTGNLIMISARENSELSNLQKEIVKKTKDFGKTIKPYYEEFENNFHPHITIARKLNDDKFSEAKSKLEKPISLHTRIDKLRLHMMNKVSDADELEDESVIFYEFNNSY